MKRRAVVTRNYKQILGQSAQQYSRELIRKIQERLYNLGIARDILVKTSLRKDGTWDGILGEGTKQAIKIFQTYNNLPATGYPDEQTLKLLGIEQYDENELVLPSEIARQQAHQKVRELLSYLSEGETLDEFLWKIVNNNLVSIKEAMELKNMAQNMGIKGNTKLDKITAFGLLGQYEYEKLSRKEKLILGIFGGFMIALSILYIFSYAKEKK